MVRREKFYKIKRGQAVKNRKYIFKREAKFNGNSFKLVLSNGSTKGLQLMILMKKLKKVTLGEYTELH